MIGLWAWLKRAKMLKPGEQHPCQVEKARAAGCMYELLGSVLGGEGALQARISVCDISRLLKHACVADARRLWTGATRDRSRCKDWQVVHAVCALMRSLQQP